MFISKKKYNIFFYSSVTDESFVDETCVWCKYEILILASIYDEFICSLFNAWLVFPKKLGTFFLLLKKQLHHGYNYNQYWNYVSYNNGNKLSIQQLKQKSYCYCLMYNYPSKTVFGFWSPEP